MQLPLVPLFEQVLEELEMQLPEHEIVSLQGSRLAQTNDLLQSTGQINGQLKLDEGAVKKQSVNPNPPIFVPELL